LVIRNYEVGIWILEPFEYQTYWSLVFKWSVVQMSGS
jgi:hypothetical protein